MLYYIFVIPLRALSALNHSRQAASAELVRRAAAGARVQLRHGNVCKNKFERATMQQGNSHDNAGGSGNEEWSNSSLLLIPPTGARCVLLSSAASRSYSAQQGSVFENAPRASALHRR